jgi:flagellar motor component MotA
MILVGFLLLSGVFFLFAAVSGNIGYFFNLDSLLLLLTAALLYSVFTFHWKEFKHGLKTMVTFRVDKLRKDKRAASHFKALMVVTMAVGFISTAQGLLSHRLAVRDSVESALIRPLGEALCYASFTTVYAVMFSFLLFYPVYLQNRDTSN